MCGWSGGHSLEFAVSQSVPIGPASMSTECPLFKRKKQQYNSSTQRACDYLIIIRWWVGGGERPKIPTTITNHHPHHFRILPTNTSPKSPPQNPCPPPAPSLRPRVQASCSGTRTATTAGWLLSSLAEGCSGLILGGTMVGLGRMLFLGRRLFVASCQAAICWRRGLRRWRHGSMLLINSRA